MKTRLILLGTGGGPRPPLSTLRHIFLTQHHSEPQRGLRQSHLACVVRCARTRVEDRVPLLPLVHAPSAIVSTRATAPSSFRATPCHPTI